MIGPDAFIAKWKANARGERSSAQEHFINLCELLGEPTPNTDPTGAAYAFEKGASKATGGDGWADVWKRGCFGWEYKGKHRDLDAAHRQLLLYAGALENPPLLIVSDIERIVIRTNWTNAVSERHEVRLDELREPPKQALLKWVFSAPERLRPGKTRQALTEQAAADFAELAGRLRARGHSPPIVAHFVNRLVFCLFADDVGLLPAGLFEQMLGTAIQHPDRFAGLASLLFRAMRDRGGMIGFTPVQWFNGGLFDDDTALPLDRADVHLLSRVSALDWAEIDPSILGTLFERGLDPDKRGTLGAFYTDRDKIARLVDAVVTRPLLAEWEQAKAAIEAALDRQAAARKDRRAQRSRAQAEATAAYRQFLHRIRNFRVLDPACGSGNFLYVALNALKDLELRVNIEAEALGHDEARLAREFVLVGPEAVRGIEINPYAAELARVSVWIGHIQWARRHGLPMPADPVLRTLDTIECRDAILGDDGAPAAWPQADAIVGNPPFLGDKVMIGALGEEYTARLRRAYAGRLPAGADLVCYWFERAREELASGRAGRVGLVATQSIRKGASRTVLDRVRDVATIVEAWRDEPWTIEGADVRVSLISFAQDARPPYLLDGKPVTRINADLSSSADVTAAGSLASNLGLSFQGTIKVGPFDLDAQTARAWLREPTNANGRGNSDVVRPWRNGLHVMRRDDDAWVIDFGTAMSEEESSFYAKPFASVLSKVKPIRDKVRRDNHRRYWWRHGEARPGLRAAIAPLTRYIVTPRVAKHRVFVWMHPSVVPDSRLYAIAREDDVAFGVLHSRIHETWALANASRHGVGNDPTYNSQTCFETFPFPDGLSPDRPAGSYAADRRAQAIAAAAEALVAARNRWLNPDDLVVWTPEVVPGFPDRPLPRNSEAAGLLKKRTMTALYNTRGSPEGTWLDTLHRRLDEAVAAAYGWSADLDDSAVLANLLALNRERSAGPISIGHNSGNRGGGDLTV